MAELIVALDVNSRQEAVEKVKAIGDSVGFYKIGLELFTAEGPDVVKAVKDLGKKVFLDLKFHDIPRTVERAVKSGGRLGVDLMTIHSVGGKAMIRAAVSSVADTAIIPMQDYLESSAYDASQEQLEIMQSADSGSKFAEDLYNRRLRRLIISMLYGTGIRRAEIIGLKRSSVDFSRASLRVRGKGDKMREIPLVPSLVQEISLYLKAVSSIVGEVSSADAPLLVTDKGKPLYPEFVDRAVKKELDGTGATGRKSPHVLRHSLATALLDGGADLNAIKEMLGHSSLAATEVYTHNTVERLKTQYMNAHPRAKNKDSND